MGGGERNEVVWAALQTLADEHGAEVLAHEFELLVKEWARERKRPRGRPQLTNDMIMHLWLAIETEMYRKKKKGNSIKGISGAIKLRGRNIWEVHLGEKLGKGDGWFEVRKSARRWHTKGNALMKANPKLAKRWMYRLELQKKLVDEKWTIERINDRRWVLRRPTS